MKYEKLPTEDYDQDARELSVELSSNIDADEELESALPITKSDISDTNTVRPKKNRKCNPWVRRFHISIFLLFTTVVVFTFLPSGINSLISWRHKHLYGSTCNSSPKDDVKPKSKDNINLHITPAINSNPVDPYTQLVDLPSKYIPTPKDTNPTRSLIIIGDTHGMLTEFQALMQKLDVKGYLEKSHIVLAGDMISKGPDSLGLLDMAIAMNASCVRGNHENDVMRIHWKLKKAGKLGHLSSDEDDEEHDDDENDQVVDKRSPSPKKHKNKNKKKGKHHKVKQSARKLAKSLKPHHAKYIDSCPLILKMDGVSNIGDVAVVHAGMVPGVELKRQKPSVLMNIRTFVKNVPTPGRRGIHWSRVCHKILPKLFSNVTEYCLC